MPGSGSRGFQIAIDGPVAAGKSTVAKKVAEKLCFLYVDTGAMYRVATLLAFENSVAFDDEGAIVELVEGAEIELKKPEGDEVDGRLCTVVVNGEDVSWKIRSQDINKNVAKVAMLSEVRAALVKKQQEIAEANDVVMEGRDITSVVLPDANLKIYLDANLAVRVEREYWQLRGEGHQVSREEVEKQLVERDELDKNRETDPLRVVEGAWVFDTSDLGIDEVVGRIVERVGELRSG